MVVKILAFCHFMSHRLLHIHRSLSEAKYFIFSVKQSIVLDRLTLNLEAHFHNKEP